MVTKIAILGAGLVGRRTARALSQRDNRHPNPTSDQNPDPTRDASNDRHGEIVLVSHTRPPNPVAGVTVVRGWPHPEAIDADIVVLATESAYQPALATQLVRQGTDVVTTADNPDDIDRLWALDPVAREIGATLVVGAAYSPGVSTLLATYLARGLDSVTTISTAHFGTGGPTCAREHHRAMGSAASEVHHGALRASRGGSGRELVWFPDPIGAADCYRAGLADPFLLHQAFPTVPRIESRQAATRRDRLTARLPMLRPPHAEGLVGAVWAEVRGTIDGRVEHRAMAATAAQATGAAAMAAAFVRNSRVNVGFVQEPSRRRRGEIQSHCCNLCRMVCAFGPMMAHKLLLLVVMWHRCKRLANGEVRTKRRNCNDFGQPHRGEG